MGRVIFDPIHLHELDRYVQKKTGDPDAEWWKNTNLIPKDNAHYQAILQFRKDLKRTKSVKEYRNTLIWIIKDTETGEKMEFKTANDAADYFNCQAQTVRVAKYSKRKLLRRYVVSTKTVSGYIALM